MNTRCLGSSLNHALQCLPLMGRISLHRVDQVGNEIGTPLILVDDLAPCGFRIFVQALQIVVSQPVEASSPIMIAIVTHRDLTGFLMRSSLRKSCAYPQRTRSGSEVNRCRPVSTLTGLRRVERTIVLIPLTLSERANRDGPGRTPITVVFLRCTEKFE